MNIGGFLRRSAVGIVLLAIFAGCSYAALDVIVQRASTSAWRSTCQANLKTIALACQQYRADYDGYYPPLSDGGSRGWTDMVASYQPRPNFECPVGYGAAFSPSSDYFFNARLAMLKETSVQDPVWTISFGEGVDNGPPNSHYWELPNDLENEDSMTRRHYGVSNYVFADGHVKFLTPQRFRDREQNEPHIKFSPGEMVTAPKARPKVSLP